LPAPRNVAFAGAFQVTAEDQPVPLEHAGISTIAPLSVAAFMAVWTADDVHEDAVCIAAFADPTNKKNIKINLTIENTPIGPYY
jgi:hypothetical protein